MIIDRDYHSRQNFMVLILKKLKVEGRNEPRTVNMVFLAYGVLGQ